MPSRLNPGSILLQKLQEAVQIRYGKDLKDLKFNINSAEYTGILIHVLKHVELPRKQGISFLWRHTSSGAH